MFIDRELEDLWEAHWGASLALTSLLMTIKELLIKPVCVDEEVSMKYTSGSIRHAFLFMPKLKD